MMLNIKALQQNSVKAWTRFCYRIVKQLCDNQNLAQAFTEAALKYCHCGFDDDKVVSETYSLDFHYPKAYI